MSAYHEDGHGIARDGRKFSPTIPAGATVSWKRIESASLKPADRPAATHVLAVWSHLDQMDAEPACLRDTPRGVCLPYYADANAIAYLIESPVPPPEWLDADAEPAAALADCILAQRRQSLAPTLGGEPLSRSQEGLGLELAVRTYHSVFGEWPILATDVRSAVRRKRFPAALFREEAERIFALIRKRIAIPAVASR